ncbi:MAG: energy transducer TonB [Terracidiphilus sp.]|jgi:TonB family protein
MATVRSPLAFLAVPARLGAIVCALVLALGISIQAQQQTTLPGAAPQAEQQPAPPAPVEKPLPGAMTEEALKQLLVGKELYLRGGYQSDLLSFDEHGRLIGHSPQGSYTLSAIQIDKARLTKHKVELEGARYGLHFVGQLANEDPSTAFDRVRITPRKKVVRITIDREIVVKAKKEKAAKPAKEKGKKGKKGKAAVVNTTAAPETAAPEEPQAQTAKPEAPQTQAAPTQGPELSEADQLKASIAAAPAAERPADAKSVTTTFSPAHATQVLRDALDQIFAQGLDERMMAAMPDFWKLYYQAVADKVDYRPKDPAILRQGMVDKKARLLSITVPDSNEFAQANSVAGMAQYHVVVGPDGKVSEVAVSRPIGFGLDENAEAAIRKAQFEPAIKDGQPVPVLLNLDVPFRIFSKRTNTQAAPQPPDKPAEPTLPGPYSVPRD